MNSQPVEGRVDGVMLDVVKIWRSIQGEGPYTGRPAVFVRLAGCTLKCSFCFHGSTRVRMGEYSVKMISEVRAGDSVLSYDTASGQFVSRTTARVMSRQVDSIYRVCTGATKTYVTGNHPILVRGKGWVEAQDLERGDRVIHLSLSVLRTLHNPMKDPLVAKRNGARRKGWPIDRSPEGVKAISNAARHRMLTSNPMKIPGVAVKGFLNRKDRGRRTGAEKFVEVLGRDLGLVFVGDGTLVVGSKAVPDFVFEGTNKLVEVWDSGQTEFLGRNDEWKRDREELFNSFGYQVLFLPVTPFPMGDEVGSRKLRRVEDRQEEISRVISVLSDYRHNGAIVDSVERISAQTNPKAWVRLAGKLDSRLTVYNLEVEGTRTYLANGMVVHNCDTDYTSVREMLTVAEVVERIEDVAKQRDLVVLTGGEPFRQDVEPLIDRLRKYTSHDIQVETNGTVHRDNIPYHAICVVCSPKTKKVVGDLVPYIQAWKYVVRFGDLAEDGLPKNLARPAGPGEVYVQPMDEGNPEKNKQNIEAALHSCLTFGYRLSLQVHKIVGVD